MGESRSTWNWRIPEELPGGIHFLSVLTCLPRSPDTPGQTDSQGQGQHQLGTSQGLVYFAEGMNE